MQQTVSPVSLAHVLCSCHDRCPRPAAVKLAENHAALSTAFADSEHELARKLAAELQYLRRVQDEVHELS